MTGRQTRNLILFFIIAFGFTWAFWVPLALADHGYLRLPVSLHTYLTDRNPGAWGPLVAAIIVAFIGSGRRGVLALLSRMVKVRFGAIWYGVAFLLYPAIIGLSGWIAVLRGADLPQSEAFANPITIPIAFVWIFFLGGPLQEEAGWRGTATDTIQDTRIGALGGSIFVGIIWGLWHLPLFFTPRDDIYYNQPIWGLVGSTILLAILLTWVYNNTGKSLFAVMIMHASYNWSNYLFPTLQDDLGGQTYFILMIAVVLAVVWKFGPAHLSRKF